MPYNLSRAQPRKKKGGKEGENGRGKGREGKRGVAERRKERGKERERFSFPLVGSPVASCRRATRIPLVKQPLKIQKPEEERNNTGSFAVSVVILRP